jgi:hypothetical protein
MILHSNINMVFVSLCQHYGIGVDADLDNAGSLYDAVVLGELLVLTDHSWPKKAACGRKGLCGFS